MMKRSERTAAVHTLPGRVMAWGSNHNGQFGNGSFDPSSVPILVFTGAKAIAAGGRHSLALKTADATVWAWGYNFNGQLGNGTNADSRTPVQVQGLSNVIAIAAPNTAYHSLALKRTGSVWAWGSNDFGQLGFGYAGPAKPRPVPVLGLTNAIAVAAGPHESLALQSGVSTVQAWGLNEAGQLGDGTQTDRNTPLPVSSLGNVELVAAGRDHSVALGSDGKVWAWGSNGSEQLGYDTATLPAK